MPRIALTAALVLLAAGAALTLLPRPAPPAAAIDLAPTEAPATAVPQIVVDVAGAVARPGVVRLAPGARVLDALLAAGGMTGDADLYALNKAAPLRDGDRIYVPRPGEIPPARTAGAPADDRVDLNRASARELESLPGVGPGIAARIVRSREQRPFAKVEELQTRGILSGRAFADVRDLVFVR